MSYLTMSGKNKSQKKATCFVQEPKQFCRRFTTQEDLSFHPLRSTLSCSSLIFPELSDSNLSRFTSCSHSSVCNLNFFLYRHFQTAQQIFKVCCFLDFHFPPLLREELNNSFIKSKWKIDRSLSVLTNSVFLTDQAFFTRINTSSKTEYFPS